MTTRLPDTFAAALRAELLDVARNSQKRRRSRRWITGATIFTLTLGAAGTATAISNLLPGAPMVAELSKTTTYTYPGSQTIYLGSAPSDANALSITFTCHSPGRYEVVDTFSVECVNGEPNSVAFTTEHLPADEVLKVTAPPALEWELTVAFVNKSTTPWAINEDGQTYGVANEHGSPDLIAVVADKGTAGFVRASDLADINGESAADSFESPEDALRWQESMRGTSSSIPVFLHDGRTEIGTYTINW